MANTQSMCTSFLGDLLVGTHNFTPISGDTFKAALYLASATMNASTPAYTTTGEVVGTNYTAGGVTVTNTTAPTADNTTPTTGVAYWTPGGSFTFTNVTLPTAFDAVLIYNSSKSNRSVSVHTFGSQTVTAGTFVLTMPANTSSTGLIRLGTV